MKFSLLKLVVIFGLLSSCMQVDKKQVGEMLKKDPTLITDAIKANPSQFIEH